MDVLRKIEKLLPEFIALRHDLHRHAEVSHHEVRTSEVIAQKLRSWGIEVHEHIGGHGVVGILKNGIGAKSIALRADMDGLPIIEENAFPHASVNTGAMHACGHDGHMAALLLAARYLSESRSFNGTVVFVFQPSEEMDGGANDMIKDGVLERFPADYYFACHNWPGIPEGRFSINDSAIMASSNMFEIRIKTDDEHTDSSLVAVSLAQALYGIISRQKRPIDPAVLSICSLQSHQHSNHCSEATLTGTVRTFSNEVTDLIETQMKVIAAQYSLAFACSINVHFERQVLPTVNSPECYEMLLQTMTALYGSGHIQEQEPVMPSEDFSEFLQKRKGALFFIGAGDGSHRAPGHGPGPCELHNPSYDYNDRCLAPTAAVFAKLVETYLS